MQGNPVSLELTDQPSICAPSCEEGSLERQSGSKSSDCGPTSSQPQPLGQSAGGGGGGGKGGEGGGEFNGPESRPFSSESLSGMALGLSGVGAQFLLLRRFLGAPLLLRDIGAWACVCLALVYEIFSAVLRFAEGWEKHVQAMNHRVNGGLVTTFSMAGMNIVFILFNLVGADSSNAYIAGVVWLGFVVLQLTWIAWFYVIRLRRRASFWTDVNPTWLVATVGVAEGVSTGSVFYPKLAVGLFWFASVHCWLLVPIVVVRRFCGKRDPPLKARPPSNFSGVIGCCKCSLLSPANAILMAPASLCFSSYMTNVSVEPLASDAFGLFQLVLALTTSLIAMKDWPRCSLPHSRAFLLPALSRRACSQRLLLAFMDLP